MPDNPEVTVSCDHLIKLELKGHETYILDGSDNEYNVSDLLGTVINRTSNDRSSYQYVFDIKDKVGNIDASDRPTEREYEIYNYYKECSDAAWANIDLSDSTAVVDEDLLIQKVAEKYGITEEEANRICNKVVLYQIS